jgi:hypothetical protein
VSLHTSAEQAQAAEDAQLATRPLEREIATDAVRRGLFVAPVLVAVAAAVWGGRGALSAAFGVGLAFANLTLSGALLSRAARISPAAIGGAALGGYVVRLGLLTAVLFAVEGQPWVAIVPLVLTLAVTHLGLLVLEARHVSASLAFPAVRPAKRGF